MNQKTKILIIFFLLFSAVTAHATTIYPLPESFLAKIWRCKWHLSCYKEKLGATITTINASDLIKDSRSTINTNFSNLNSYKIENATSSVAAITTLSNLTETGVLASSTFRGSAVGIPYGGTGSTTLSSNQVLLGNGTGAIGVVSGFGTSNQLLTSNGISTAPSWQTAATDQSLNYTWTGFHAFNAATTTLGAGSKFGIGTSSPFTLLGVAGTITTNNINATSSPGIATSTFSGDLTVSGTLTGSLRATSTIFTATSTWIKPTNVSRVKVRLQGGGGGGGGAGSAGTSLGGGGGSGAYCEAWISVTGNVVVNLGAAGAGVGGLGSGPAAGTTGASVSFAGSITVTAGGGTGGSPGSASNGGGGGGGSCTNADISFPGGSGENGGEISTKAGLGSDSHYGYSSHANRASGASTNGGSGGLYGAGGNGASSSGGSTANGGNGSAGFVIVEWTE